MKKLIYLMMFVLPFTAVSCVQDMSEDDVYYIRYEASVDKPADGIFQVTFTMSDGGEDVLKYSSQNDFSVVVGPVKQDFKARIHATCNGGTGFKGAYTRILVSKNNEPFALKTFHGGEEYLESMSQCVVGY